MCIRDRAYTPAMMATLLMPAGITSEASIRYKDEDRLLETADDVDYTYIHKAVSYTHLDVYKRQVEL